ncbi:hypothetical protein BGX31_008918 [Mortierella sp. GBA43]|nr:hypothetical protein BGX31_008918 [Mortierella sp. GBA43]
MSTTPIPIWTLFSEVLVQHCVPCKADPNSSSRPRRRISEIDTWLEPPAKKRLKEDTDRYQRSNGVSLGKIKSGRKSQEWILARQWLEQLGSISSLPCGHQLDPVSLPPLSVTFQEGTIMAKLNGDDILAVRQDDPDDQSWAEFATRNSLHNRTLFSALEAFKFSKQITVDVSLVRPDSSSVLQIGFSVSLHQSLFSHSLSCPRDIDTAMQDLMYFVFPPPKDPSHNYTENAIKDLYTHLKPVTTAEPPPGIQPEALNPQLLPFQRQTVAWCLKRECGVVAATGEVRYKEPAILEKLPFSWEQVSTPSGVDLFINRLCGLMCLADPDLVATEPEPRGGILAEEMGLGKTVEMLALILLNRRKLDISESDSDTFGTGLERHLSETSLNDSNRVVNKDVKASTGKALIKSTATLIITPPSILHQWANEIENHAPSLRVFIYNQQAHEQISAEQLAQYDVVITTYTVLSKEINFTNEFDRPRRHKRQYVPRKSPFIQIEWWRVCLDEAQMIEGGTVSQAAAMAFLIPRVMSWAVSGTPIRRNVADLQSLLMFLNQEPIASNKHLWRLLTSTSFRSTFISNHQRIMHRFAKKDVVQELALPPQLELAYGIHFTEIERTNYNEKWEQCLTECNFETTTDDSEELEKLRSWFVRLRQICCHPQIGSRNKESLGKTNLRTIDEVLDAMVQQNNSQLHIKERTLFTTKLKRAVLTARIHNDMAEMNLFTQLALEAQRQVEFWDAKVQEQGKSTGGKKLHQARAADGDDYMDQEISDNDETQTEVDDLGRIKSSAENPYSAAILRRRDWQEQHHRTLFFTACFYHDLEMEVEEVELYKRAEEIRQKILAPPEKRFDRLLAVVNHSMRKMNLCDDFALPASQFKGGIVLSQHLEQLEFVTNVLNKQMIVLGHWRQDLIDRLTQPLMQDGEEGEQYQYSIDLQHTLESYLHFYGRMLSFRRDLISGTEEALATHVSHVQSQREHEAMAQRRKARIQTEEHGLGECSKEKEEGLDRRLEREMNDLITLDLVSTLRSIRVGIKSIANDTLLPREEKQMAEMEDLRLKEEQNRQSRLVLKLEKYADALALVQNLTSELLIKAFCGVV